MAHCRGGLFIIVLLATPALASSAEALPSGALLQLGAARLRHPYDRVPELFVLYSPDGKTLASRSDANTIRLWETATGRLRHQLADLKGGVTCFAFSPDSRLLASGSAGLIHVWDVESGKHAKQFPAHEDEITSLAFTADGAGIVSGSADRSVRLWDRAAGKELRKFGAGLDAIVAVATNGKHVAAGGRRSVVHIWDLESCKELHKLEADGSRLFGLAFAPDGQTIAVGSKTIVRLWGTTTGKEVRQFGRPISDDVTTHNNDETLAFSADGTLLATGGRKVRLWEAATAKELRAFGGGGRKVVSVAFSADGKTLAVGGGDHEVHLWDVATGKETVAGAGHRDRILCTVWSPDGRCVATGGQDHQVLLWDAVTGKLLHSLTGHGSGVVALAFAEDSQRLASGDRGGRLRLWDAATGKELHQFQGHRDDVRAIAFAPNGKYLASGGKDFKLRLFDIARERELHQFPDLPGGITAVAFSADSRTLVTGTGAGQLLLWSVVDGEALLTRTKEDEDAPIERPRPVLDLTPVGRLFLVPGGKRLSFWQESGALARWDISLQRPIGRIEGPAGPRFGAAFAPDGRTIALRDRDHRITLREIATGSERRVLAGSGETLQSVAFAPDGRRLVSVGDDATALIWDVTGRQREGTLPPVRLAAKELDAAWSDLAGDDGGRVHQALWTLVAGAADALPYFEEKLKPVPIDPKRIDRLIADLDGGQFAARERARMELEELAELAEDALKKTLAGKPSLEMKSRLEKLLAKVDKERNALNPHRLRILRLTECLEHLGTPEARKLLEIIAAAPAELRLLDEVKEEARASLLRLDQRR